MRDIAFRREQESKKKAKVRHFTRVRIWPFDDEEDGLNSFGIDRVMGMRAHTPKFCSCWMCGNPRKYFNEKTMQEKKSEALTLGE